MTWRAPSGSSETLMMRLPVDAWACSVPSWLYSCWALAMVRLMMTWGVMRISMGCGAPLRDLEQTVQGVVNRRDVARGRLEEALVVEQIDQLLVGAHAGDAL